MWRVVLLVTILGRQCQAEDQSVLELRKTVYALHDIKIMMQVDLSVSGIWGTTLALVVFM